MVTGMAILGIVDNFRKFIAVEISLWQFHFVRSLIAVPVIVVFGLLFGWDLNPNDFGQFWAAICFYLVRCLFILAI